VPTVGVIVTVRIVCAEGPEQPVAVTCMLTVPENPFAQVITPVAALIAPAAGLLIDQLKPVLFVEVVANAVVVVAFVSWQVGGVPVIAVGVPAGAVSVIITSSVDEEQPVEMVHLNV
jgi:hypothetical protein